MLEALEKKRRQECYLRYWQPYEAQGKQLQAFSASKKIFGVLGGNRSGKTELGAFISVAWALGKKFFEGEPAYEWIQHLPIPESGPRNIWVVGLDYPTLRDVIWREKFKTGRDHPPLLPSDKSIVTKVVDGDFQIFFANGSVITGKSADSGREKFQGASVDLVWIDEEPEVDIFDECYQRTIDCGGKILLTLTPLTDISSGVRTPWVFDLYEDWKQGKKDVEFVQLSVLDNPFVPQAEKEKLLEKWSGHPEEKARLYGGFVQRSGLIYNTWNPAKHLVRPYVIPGHWTRIVSIDPAATGVTAAIWMAVDPKGNLIAYREYYERDRIISEHAKAILIRNGGETVDIWLIDPKWGAQRNAETHKQNVQLYREAGIPVRLAEVDEDFGLNVSREYINATVTEGSRHPNFTAFEDMHNFRYEIEHYVWSSFARGDMKGLSKEKPMKRNDHLMNSFQYACALRPRPRRAEPLAANELQQRMLTNSYT